MMNKLVVASGTLNLIPMHWKHNSDLIKSVIGQAKEKGVQLLCLPELCITGYGCQDMFFSKWISEKALVTLFEIIPFTKGLHVAIGLPLWVNGDLYNACAMVGDAKILGFSLKQNLPDDGIYYEPRWFKPWPAGEVTAVVINGLEFQAGELIYDIHGAKVAFEICEDAWRQKRPAKNLCSRGTEIILNPSASHFEFHKGVVREELIRSSSEKFNCVFIHSNMLGNESGRIIFEGDTIIAQNGKVLARGEYIPLKDFSLAVESITLNDTPVGLPPLSLPEKNRQFYLSATLALHDYLRKSHSKCFVVSLSGGADSACCAVLISLMIKRSIEEIGKESFLDRINRLDLLKLEANQITSKLLYCVYQSTENSSETTFLAAKGLAENLGATFYHWSVQDELNSGLQKVEKAIGRKLEWETDDIALQNIQARMRAPFVWMLANIYGGLLITTSNRSEGDVGYATMDGDTSGSIAPLAGVDKPFIIEWLKWAEAAFQITGLRLINQQQPTAELRPKELTQTDEADLMPYTVLLYIERKFLKERLSPEEIKLKLIKEKNIEILVAHQYIERFFKLWGRNQWKRERLAPSFHFDDFNIDPKSWMRFPILNSGFQGDL